MGHAGAIVMGDKGSYAGKKAALEAAGVTVCADAQRRGRGAQAALSGRGRAHGHHICASTEAVAFPIVYPL